MNIDKSAPLNGRKEIAIAAPIESVWAAITDIERWPEWQPDVSAAKLEGALSVGAVFRWKAKGLNITSTIQELERPRRIGWTGNSIGMRAIHIWSLEREGDSTRVVTEESLSGWFPQILKLFDAYFLDKSLSGSLNVLKVRAERE